MPEEVDSPTETLQERIEEARREGSEEAKRRDRGPGWLTYLAVTTALMAVLAAISALLSGQASDDALLRANEAVYYEALAVDAWSEFQADSIKAVADGQTAGLLTQLHAPTAAVASYTADAARRKANQQQDQASATEAEKQRDQARAASDKAAAHRQRFAFAVTLFQVGIGLSAVAALVRRRTLWVISLVGALAGVGFLVVGLAPAGG